MTSEPQSGNAVVWVLVNDREGEEPDVLGGFAAPPSLTWGALYEIERAWLAEHPYDPAEVFLEWLVSEHGLTRVPVEPYPFG